MTLKHLLSGIAIASTFAIAGSVWAQNNLSSGNGTGMPGPNSGAGNLSPYSGGGPSISASTPAATSAAPSAHHPVRHAGAMHAHHKYMARKVTLTGDTTAQLNREELARAQIEAQTAEKKFSQLREDQAKKQEQLRNMYDMLRASSSKL